MTPSPSAIIIGAGAGGIATATRLSRAGYQVQVLEKNGDIGGRCSLLSKDGYRFDQGPSLVLMPELFHQAFADLHTSIENEGITLLQCEPNYCVWFSDGDSVELSRDTPRLKAQIEHHEGPGGFSRFCAFFSSAGLQYQMAMESVFRQRFPNIWDMLHPSLLKAMWDIRPWTSAYTNASNYFRSEKMRRVWTFTSMYLGMSPHKAPGTFSFLPFIEISDGIWYPKGGFQKILKALAGIGCQSGVKYRLNCPVANIQLSDKGDKATGVRLSSGEILSADLVVVNADLVYAYNNLLPSTPYSKKLQHRPTSPSSLSFFWGFDETIAELRPHNVFLADKYRQSFDTIFDQNRTPDDLSFYVNVPSRIDATAAPDGKDSVMVLVPVAHLSDGAALEKEDWDRFVTHIRDIVIDTIEARTGAYGLRSKLVHESINTPVTWNERFNLHRGSILGLSHSFSNALWFRPQMKHASIKGLYFVGCSTHPGAGVPSALVSGKLVSEQILLDGVSPRGRAINQGRIMGFIAGFVLVVALLFTVL